MEFEDDFEGKPNTEVEYEVGKNRPPKQHQFKKGDEWRGNRYGRPAGSPNLDTAMVRVFSEKLPIIDPNTKRKLTGTEAYALRLRSDALKGKTAAMRLVHDWHETHDAREEAKREGSVSRNDEDLIERAMQRRLKRMKEE